MVGNGVTNWKYDGVPAYFHMAYYFGLVDDKFYKAANAECDFSYYNFYLGSNLSDECNDYMDQFNAITADINVYDVLGKCYVTTEKFSTYRTHNEKTILNDAKKGLLTADRYTPFLY
jgi:hypothetical protein